MMRHRIGHRGAFLITIGTYDLFYGLFLAIGGQLQHEPLIGEKAWGIIWITTGFVLILGAPARRDAIFYALAIGIKMVWALEYLRIDIIEHVPDDWIRCAYWLALSAVIIVAAFWPEPTHIVDPGEPHITGIRPPAEAEQRARDA